MTNAELAHDFTAMLKKFDFHGAGEKYNADTIASYEAMDGPMAVCHGKEAVAKKGEWWTANHEIHGCKVEGPYVNGDQFVVRFTMDVTAKESGKRMTLDEMGVYHVEGGKIVSERFFYGAA